MSEQPSIVPDQKWRTLEPAPLGELTPRLRVCVVIPARDCQPELDRTLAALSAQTYPAELLEVLVVDDASTPPLTVPALAPGRTRVLRVEEAQEHGSGRARDRGARDTDADVVLFLDADMIVDRWHVEAHARWHHLAPYPVVIGRKWFVDVDGISPEDVARAVPTDGLEELLEGRPRQRHSWQENFIRKRGRLTRDSEDTFVAVVGADVSVGRELYERSGGFASFGLRGIVDTEFGFRAFTSGGLIIPDREAISFHQGARSFASRGDEIKRERIGLAANHLPLPMFRPVNTGRRWAVPRVHASVRADGAAPHDVLLTVDTLLGSSFTDLHVEVAGQVPRWLQDHWAHEQRVTLVDHASASGFPSPLTLTVSAGMQVGPEAVALAVDRLRGAPVVRSEVAPGLVLELRPTRWLRRVELAGGALPVAEPVEPTVLGLAPAEHHLTSQGMIALGPPPPPKEKKRKKKKKLSLVARARRKARHLLSR